MARQEGMMLERWYRWATAIPYVVTLICGVGARLAHAPTAMSKVLILIAAVGLYALIPYTLYLVALVTVLRPRTASDYRRSAILAPLVIAVPFSIVETAVNGGLGAMPSDVLQSMAVYGVAALVVGYAYVAIVELGATAIRGGIA